MPVNSGGRVKHTNSQHRVSCGFPSTKRANPLLKAAVLSATLAVFPAQRALAGFTPGDLVVEQIGNGTQTLQAGGNSVFLDDFSTTGTPGVQLAMPSSGTSAILAQGSSSSGGFITSAPNNLSLVVSGYNATGGVGTVTTGTLAGVGSVDLSGNVTLVGTNTTFAAGSISYRSATTDGLGDYYLSGGSVTAPNSIYENNYSGTTFSGAGTSVGGAAGSPLTTNNRCIHDFGGTIYYMTTSAGPAGIYTLSSAGGAPTNAGNKPTLLFSTSNAAYDFSINTAGNVAYVAVDGAGVQKWTFNGTSWTEAYALVNTSGSGGSATAVRGLAVDWSNPNSPTLYFAQSDAQHISSLVDTGSAAARTILAAAPTGTRYQSLTIAGLPAVWTATSSGNFLSGSTFSSLYSNWSYGLANGINLSFQDVNSTATPLPIEATNNSAITSASSIVFGSGGYGQLAGGTGGTQYTVDGTALTLTGTAATGSGITNNSVSTQTINLPLTLGAAQTIKAAAGNLSFGGATLALGSGSQNYALTIDGAFNTTISNAISDGGTGAGGTLTKNGSGTLTLSNTNSYSGGTTINAGILVAGNGLASVGSGDITVNGGSAIFSNTTTTAVFNLIKSGFNSGSGYWNGLGINSATAAGDTTHLTTVGMMQPAVATTYNGQSLGTADVAVKYTYYGDANLDGMVDGADYQQIDNGFGMGLTGWQNGDFNYDGVVDGSDFSLIDNTFNQITATGASPLAILAGPALASASAVPEPTTLGLLSIGAISLLSRRRRIQV
jgi:fibronectin-binding autotransporter adhesin